MKTLIKSMLLVVAAGVMQGCVSTGNPLNVERVAFGFQGNSAPQKMAQAPRPSLPKKQYNFNTAPTPQHNSSKLSTYAQLEKTEQELIAQLNRIQRERAKQQQAQRPQSSKQPQRFYDRYNHNHATTGKASYYGQKFHGRTTASGEPFNMHAMTAAHKTLAFGTKVKVTNLRNNRSVLVTINDRGPFVGERIIDLSLGAAQRIDMVQAGIGEIKMEVLN